jgi:maltose/moltooligosaccharide transporter
LDIPDSSSAYQDAGDWMGILFGVYNLGFCDFMLLPCQLYAKKVGRKKNTCHVLIIGGLGLISIYIMPDKNWLILSMIGVGIAWASILAMPYAILAGSISSSKNGSLYGYF